MVRGDVVVLGTGDVVPADPRAQQLVGYFRVFGFPRVWDHKGIEKFFWGPMAPTNHEGLDTQGVGRAG